MTLSTTKHVYQLSSGMRQRAVLARGLLVATPLLFLDEPTVGLDPVTARDIRRVVELRVSGLGPETLDAVQNIAGVIQVSSTLHGAGAGRLRLHLAAEQPLERVLEVLRAQGTAVRWVGTAPAGLEDAFLAYTGATEA
jgi:energy-coupling factor transporter ATP-binding protein EcfA2